MWLASGHLEFMCKLRALSCKSQMSEPLAPGWGRLLPGCVSPGVVTEE